MSSRLIISAGVFCLMLLCSCSPWRFILQRDADFPIEGKILRNKEHVNVFASNAVRIGGSSSVAIRTEQITDGEFDAEFRLKGGSGFDLVLRSTPFDDSTNGGKNKLTIHLSRDTSQGIMAGTAMAVVSTADTVATVPLTISDRVPFRVTIVQQGVYTDVVMACTRIGRFTTNTPSTQWLTIIPAADATVELVDPVYRSLEDVYYQNAQMLIDNFNQHLR